MPQVVLAAGLGAIGVAAGTLTLAGAIIGTASAFYSHNEQQKQKAQLSSLNATNEIYGITQMIKESASTKKIIYGKDVKYSGSMVFAHQSQSDKDVVYLILAMAPHNLGDIKEIYVQDDRLTFSYFYGEEGVYNWSCYQDVDGSVGKEYARSISLRFTNSEIQWNESDKAFLHEIPELWTEDHKIEGNSCLYVKLDYVRGLFPYGIPNISIVSNGKRIYNVDTGHSNESLADPASILLDYLTNTDYGASIPLDTIDIQSFIDAKAYCDEIVDNEPRFECHGFLDTANSVESNIQKILDTCAGRLVFDKDWRLLVGYQYPVITLNESNLLSDIKVVPEQSRADIFNLIKGIYTNSEYDADEYTPVSSSYYQNIDKEVIPAEFDFVMIRSNKQAQRVANIILEKARNEMYVEIHCDIKILQIRVGDTIFLDNDRYGWDGKTFEVRKKTLNIGGKIDGHLVLKATQETDYDDVATSPELQHPKTNLPDFTIISDPFDIEVEEKLIKQSDIVNNKIRMNWKRPDLGFIEKYQVKYIKNETSEIEYDLGSFENTSIEFFLADTGVFTFFVRAISTSKKESNWVSLEKEIFGKKLKPSDVENLSYSFEYSSVKVKWNKVLDADLAEYEVRLGDTWENSVYIDSIRSTSIDIKQTRTAGNYKILVKAVDTLGLKSENAASIEYEVIRPNRVELSSMVYQNKVQLSWLTPDSSYPIVRYRVEKEYVDENGKIQNEFNLINTSSTFVVINETIGGNYKYYVYAYDSMGNSSGSATPVDLLVQNPPNFSLFLSDEDDFTNGQATNLQKINNKFVPNLSISESIGDHFNHMGWTSFQDMIDDGYKHLGQPLHDESKYISKVFDIGAIVDSAKVTAKLNQDIIDDAVLVEWTIKTSKDQVNWVEHKGVFSTFAQEVRYVQLELDFKANDRSFSYIQSIEVSILAEEKTEVGTSDINELDLDGTEINFQKPFADIGFIDAQPINIDARYLINFEDTSNPTSFKLKLLHPQTGNLLSGKVKWRAVGR